MTDLGRTERCALFFVGLEMVYRIPERLSFCEIDGRLIFMDIDNDAYFRLSAALESAFRNVINEESGDVAALTALLDKGILVPGRSDSAPPLTLVTAPPRRSVLESDGALSSITWLDVCGVFGSVWAMRARLRLQPLKRVLDELTALQERTTQQGVVSKRGDPESEISSAAQAFARIRPYVPVDRSCLLDSLALARYLARRRMKADLVFGVSADPFSAHCWMQAGDLVLNDTAGNASAHSPIRVV
ncbi:lasso peptide biosynthesis B2 protein [Luteimonas terrae]|uniref:Microcin J25-processing protein McjB C-terminal domain-containing protein n=1 Tax=Luteimonas terrae TaxID=1530191 RepID=A0ABU1XSS6_9GAMM|nr:lasso peptide biosynthesis B2 protein [Luteimonas terrae]MDR7191804.1 hypothetical protein [Luteimonas terrae]